MKVKILISFLFIFTAIKVFACPNFYYPNEKKPDSVRVLHYSLKLKKINYSDLAWVHAAPHKFFNSVVLRFPAGILKKAQFKLNLHHRFVDTSDEWGFAQFRTQKIRIKADEHYAPPDADQSDLYYAGDDCFTFNIEQISGIVPDSFMVDVILIYVPPFQGKIPMQVQPRATCTQPVTIPQSLWRAGLPAPKPGRTSTPTEHCIVHHSADGNGNTNYTDLVRAYYTYHTQVNGWDDIAYNYLVAANGDVYAGRDPEKASISQDNVLGAHFCAKNNLTMGVCMIGDFTSATPSSAAIQSLKNLLGWKVKKDQLLPLGSAPHPDKNGALLPVIAGHRDGCSTECPGNNLYTLLPGIRNDIVSCTVQTTLKPLAIFSADGNVHIRNAGQGNTLIFYDLLGNKIHEVLNAWAMEEIVPFTPGKMLVYTEWKDGKRVYSQLFYHYN